MFESIVNVKLLNNPLFIGGVLPMLPKYDTAELRFWLGSTGNVNSVWLRLPCLSKFFAELTESQLRVTCLRPRLISTAFGLVFHTFADTAYDRGKPNSKPKFFRFSCSSEYILHVLSCALNFNTILLSLSLS